MVNNLNNIISDCSSSVNGDQVQTNICTGCKNRDSTAVARCLTCSNFLCPNCVTAHQVSIFNYSPFAFRINDIITSQIERNMDYDLLFSLVHALFRWPPCDNFGRVDQQGWMSTRNPTVKWYFASHARWQIKSVRFKIQLKKRRSCIGQFDPTLQQVKI